MNDATKNFNTFRVLHLIWGILLCCACLLPLIYVGLGVFIAEEVRHDPHVPFNPGYFMVIFGIIGFVILLVAGILNIMSSRNFREARGRSLIFATAVVNCFTGVLGIVLAIFTFIELGKTDVRRAFDGPQTGGLENGYLK